MHTFRDLNPGSKQFAENDAKAKATDKKTKDAAKVQIHEEL